MAKNIRKEQRERQKHLPAFLNMLDEALPRISYLRSSYITDNSYVANDKYTNNENTLLLLEMCEDLLRELLLKHNIPQDIYFFLYALDKVFILERLFCNDAVAACEFFRSNPDYVVFISKAFTPTAKFLAAEYQKGLK